MNASHFESLAGLLSPKPEEPSLKDSLKRDAKVTKNQKNKNDIWDEEDAEEQVDLEDSRPAPEFDISYRQKVDAGDMFLGLSGRLPSFSHADELRMSIELPGTLFKDIHLSVFDDRVDVRCPKFRLNAPFPRSVDSDAGKAEWNSEKDILVLVLPLKDVPY